MQLLQNNLYISGINGLALTITIVIPDTCRLSEDRLPLWPERPMPPLAHR
jgi:hypothetical protein